MLGIILIAAAIAVGTWLLLVPAQPAPDPVARGVNNLHEAMLERSRSERVVKPMLKGLGSLLQRGLPQRRVQHLSNLAATGGVQGFWTPRVIAGARMISLLCGVGMAWLALQTFGRGFGIILGALFIFIGWRLIDTLLQNRARVRQDIIVSSLPDFADQIAICVQAGLSLDQAMRRTAQSNEGPIADEFKRFLRDVRIGAARSEAYEALQSRIDLPDMSSFVRSITNAERNGVSVAEVLAIQADELREKRRQRAEERAMRLPVLMLFPMVTCILPPLLAVLLGPPLIELFRTGLG